MRKKRFFTVGILFIFFSLTFVSAEILFIRGDANYDQKVDLTDSIFINNYLYKGGPQPYCIDAADANDDGKVDLSDGVYLNNYLYLGTGNPPPLPYPNAGIDPTPDTLTCGPDGRGEGVDVSKCGGISIAGNCKKQSSETNEGPGGDYCTYSNYEECCDYKTKSTTTAYGGILSPGQIVDQSADYCKDSQTLIETYLNCPILVTSSDSVDYVEKNCNDFNGPSSWGKYYCTARKVQRDRNVYDYDCGDGACKIDVNDIKKETEVLSQNGDDNYCADKKAQCGVGCSYDEYDCDSDSECAAGLDCMRDGGSTCLIGFECGCCNPGEKWDSTNNKCIQCTQDDGLCCDSNGRFRPDSYLCDGDIGTTEYACKDGNCLDQDVWKRTKKQYCSGTSASCNGKIEPNSPTKQVDCTSTQFCSGSTSWATTQPACKTAQCTSGECCDTTCGKYSFKPTTAICINDITWYGCPWGTNLGNDVGKKIGDRYCDGQSSACNGVFKWEAWNIKQDCTNTEYCEGQESPTELFCKEIACSGKSDCGTDGFINEPFCKNNDVWDKWRTWTCNNPGTKSSSCSASSTDKLREDCRESCQNGACVETVCTDNDGDGYGIQVSVQCPKQGADCNDNNAKINPEASEICGNSIDENCNGNGDDPCGATCTDGIKNQDETGIDCGGICSSQGKKCPNIQPCKINTDCQSNYCNPSTLKCENHPAGCTNECTQSSTRCSSSSVKQTCGNYDADSCLEWGGDLTCQYGCSNNQCNPSTSCTDKLYAYWKFNDLVRDGGRITDSSQTDHAGTLHTFDSFDKSAQGIQSLAQAFDGVDDYFEVSHSPLLEPGTGSFSISFWVYPDTNRENRMILSKVNGTLGVRFKGYALLLTDGGNLYAGFGDGDRKMEVYSPITSSQWTNFVIVKDDPTDKVLIYKNGAFITSISDPSQDVSYPGNIFVGRAYGPFKAFKGKLDEFAIFKRRLSAEEIRVFYTNGVNARNLC